MVDASTDKPIQGAVVVLSGTTLADSSALAPRRVLTSTDGRYLFMQLPAGFYLLNGSRTGYVTGGVGLSAPGSAGAQVALSDGEIRPATRLSLYRPASISGIVTDESGEPVVGVAVTVLSRLRQRGRVSWTSNSLTESTDDRGMYRLGGLSPGDYVVFVDQTNATVPTSVVDESQKVADTRPTGMGGTPPPILSELFAAGVPTAGAGTAGTRMVNGQLQALSRSTTQSRMDNTGHLFIYPATFYPAATGISKATILNLKSGEERVADIGIRPVKTVSVSGFIGGPDGPASFLAVTLGLVENSNAAVLRTVPGQIGTVTDAKGMFTFIAVPTGDYVLRAARVPQLPRPEMVTNTVQMGDGSTRASASSSAPFVTPPLPADPTLYAEIPVSVDVKDVTGINVDLRTGARISGRVQFVGAKAAPTPQEMQLTRASVISLAPVGSSFGSAPVLRVDPAGVITSQGLPAGTYAVNASAPGWSLLSILVDGVDVSQRPLAVGVSDITGMVVTFTDAPSDLTGAVTKRDGSPAAEAAVVAFPADETLAHDDGLNTRRVVATRVATSGAYALRNLPAGDYYVVAIDDIASAFDLTPAFLQSVVGRATRVKIAAGSKSSQALQLISIK